LFLEFENRGLVSHNDPAGGNDLEHLRTQNDLTVNQLLNITDQLEHQGHSRSKVPLEASEASRQLPEESPPQGVIENPPFSPNLVPVR
jgi:hypothetical protein